MTRASCSLPASNISFPAALNGTLRHSKHFLSSSTHIAVVAVLFFARDPTPARELFRPTLISALLRRKVELRY
jgi:hypothetical protein